VIDAWNVPGWDAQNPVYPPDAVPGVTPSIPDNFKSEPITVRFASSDEKPVQGYLTATPSTNRVYDGDTVVLLRPVKVSVVGGVANFFLFPTEDPDVTPAFTWTIKQSFPGGETITVGVPVTDRSVPTNLYALPRANPAIQGDDTDLYVQAEGLNSALAGKAGAINPTNFYGVVSELPGPNSGQTEGTVTFLYRN